MNRIQLLPDHLINKIAAGEVVERPASVVRELVDNAIDAKACHVDIDLEEGGKKLIRVRDDGNGIPADDLILAVARHATSKIRDLNDLVELSTLGFRGEALASMGAVSRLEITSRFNNDSAEGHVIELEGGKIIRDEMSPHPTGTTVSVRNLFFNTPARLKFLKGTETELSHIVDHLDRVALANPQIAFKLTHQGKNILSAPVATTLLDRVTSLYGASLSSRCYLFSKTPHQGISLSGVVGHPELSKSNQKGIVLLVNGRPVKDKTMTHAVMEGYRNFLMVGKYPFIVLALQINPQLVDMNVHPAKSEVRFANSSLIHQAIKSVVREVLENAPWQQREHLSDSAINSSSPFTSAQHKQESFSSFIKKDPIFPSQWQASAEQVGNFLYKDPQQNSFSSSTQSGGELQKDLSHSHHESVINRANTIPYGDLTILGQILSTYIVCETGTGLVLIDQHAAHERIGFEKLLARYQEGVMETQSLLIPENIELKPSDAEILRHILDELRPLGLDIEEFSGTSFMVRSLPFWLSKQVVVRDLILDLIADVTETGQITPLKNILHALFARMACHGAIRANHHLTHPEMSALLKELDATPNTSFCPHGRPVAIQFKKEELEKWFKRVM